MPFHEDRVGTMLIGCAQRHGRVDAELARLVRRRRNHAALVALPTDDHGLALQTRIEELLHGHEERVHVEVKDRSQDRSWHDTTRGLPARSEVKRMFLNPL